MLTKGFAPRLATDGRAMSGF